MKPKELMAILFKYSRVIILLLIIIVMSIINPKSFLTVQNFLNVITFQAPYLLMISCAMTLAIVIRGIDLSIGSVLAVSSCIGASFIVNGQILLGIVVALAIGIFFGIGNGFLIAKVGLPPFLATYGMNWVARGVAYSFMGGMQFYSFPSSFRAIATTNIFGVSIAVFIATVMVLILGFVSYKTVFGREIYMVGRNPRASKMSGVNTNRVIMITFIVNGFIAAFVGLMYVARLNSAEAVIGENFTLMMIAATLVGGTQFGGGRGGVARTIVGTLIIVFLKNGLNIMGVPSLWENLVIGVVIILSVLIERAGGSFVTEQRIK